MTHDFLGWTPPPDAVVEPPVHPRTVVNVFYSDGSKNLSCLARDINWSAGGNSPHVVAYAVVEEYKEPPKVAREWWIARNATERYAFDLRGDALDCSVAMRGFAEIIHVREVPDPSREVVAPRAMKAVWNDRRNCFEIYVTNVDYRDGTTMTVLGDLP